MSENQPEELERDPEEIRRDVAETRAEMSETLDDISEHVRPERVYERRRAALGQRVAALQEETSRRVGAQLATVSSTVQDAPTGPAAGALGGLAAVGTLVLLVQRRRRAIAAARLAAQRRDRRQRRLAAGTALVTLALTLKVLRRRTKGGEEVVDPGLQGTPVDPRPGPATSPPPAEGDEIHGF